MVFCRVRLIKDILYNFFEHLSRKLVEEHDLKCHRNSTLKSISSFCKSCNNRPSRCARTFRVSQTITGIERRGYAYDRITKSSVRKINNRFGNYFICSRSTDNKSKCLLFFIKSIAFRNYILHWPILNQQIIAKCISDNSVLMIKVYLIWNNFYDSLPSNIIVFWDIL